MAAAWISALLAVAAVAASDPANRDEALARYGAPAARVATPNGGERLRWVKAEESVLAGLYVTTVEVDRQGKVMRLDRRVLRDRAPAGY